MFSGCSLLPSQESTTEPSPVLNQQLPPSPVSSPSAVPSITEEQARSIAETSDCVVDGPLKDNAMYNEYTKTWWIDLDIDKPGCMPACVISEDESAEINWRCTGLIPR